MYQVNLSNQAAKELKKLPKSTLNDIILKI
jgi:mRNA-degrading endonuclease RelE of RelBE toxin-antitoxin system